MVTTLDEAIAQATAKKERLEKAHYDALDEKRRKEQAEELVRFKTEFMDLAEQTVPGLLSMLSPLQYAYGRVTSCLEQPYAFFTYHDVKFHLTISGPSADRFLTLAYVDHEGVSQHFHPRASGQFSQVGPLDTTLVTIGNAVKEWEAYHQQQRELRGETANDLPFEPEALPPVPPPPVIPPACTTEESDIEGMPF